MATRRSTRRTPASAEPTQPAEVALERSEQSVNPPTELPKKTRGKGKATRSAVSTHLESFQTTTVKTQLQNATTSRAITASAPTTATAVTTITKRTTRATKAAGAGSPLRALPQVEKTRKRTVRGQTVSATPEPEPAQAEPAQDDNSDEPELGAFFSKSEPTISSATQTAPSVYVTVLEDEIDELRSETFQLSARVLDLQAANATLLKQNTLLREQLMSRPAPSQPLLISSPVFSDHPTPPTLSPFSRFEQLLPAHLFPFTSQQSPSPQSPTPAAPRQTGQVSTNNHVTEFDNELMHVEESSPARPVFINGSESAIALLNKIENAAKQPRRIAHPARDDDEHVSDNDVTMELSPQQTTTNSRGTHNATPARAMATPSSFLTRSFSAIKSIFATPAAKAPATDSAPSPTPSRAQPAPNSFTEMLSVPPTPVGERIKTPAKKKKTNHMLKTLLKGVEHNERAKAAEWAKQVLPVLKNDRAFRAKRKRLEKPVLVKDLNHFPSSKPWETGFGDPLADLDDDDVVPVWAVYLDMMAEAEEPQTKKNKTSHEVTMDDGDILSINELFAASNSARSSPKLHSSQGHSASLQDFHPRRSTEPSPIFATPVSHNEGENIFSELQGHDSVAQIRANERENIQDATIKTVNTHNPSQGSFSVPDDSDEEDSTMISETSGTDESPAWTQAPPPAPVPAHAALPGATPADAPSVPAVPVDAPSVPTIPAIPAVSAVQQPVDEVERQRQKLMKHTPAKPSRLREATYPSPSLMSDAGIESPLAASPVKFASSLAPIFDDMPAAEAMLDEEDQAAFDALVNSNQYQQQLAANPWPAPIISYSSDEEDLSPL
jgi:hypothetical protein